MDVNTIWANCQADGTLKEKDLPHLRRVAALCDELAARFEDGKCGTVNRTLLREAALLHDVAKRYAKEGLDNAERHAEPGVVKKVITAHAGGSNCADLEDITEIIAQHKCDNMFNPKRFCLEAAILCICDKIDKFNKAKGEDDPEEREKKIKKAKKKCRKYLENIQMSNKLSEGEYDIIRQFCADKQEELAG